MVGCVRADGQCLPPMVVWNRKNLPIELPVNEIPGTVYGLSDKGWIDGELFQLWFKKHFLCYAPTSHPLLLLLDGHSSHYCPEVIHLRQPLNKGMFGPLKVAWIEALHMPFK